MMEGAAKTVDIEIESAPFSLALGNLIERGKVGIHLANVVAVGKSLRHSRLAAVVHRRGRSAARHRPFVRRVRRVRLLETLR